MAVPYLQLNSKRMVNIGSWPRLSDRSYGIAEARAYSSYVLTSNKDEDYVECIHAQSFSDLSDTAGRKSESVEGRYSKRYSNR